MNTPHALQSLINNTASEEEIALLKRLLASGEISIGGNVNQSVIIIGSGNTVELPPAALDRLGARPLLGNLERDLTGEEIAAGLARLESELPLRAPVLLNQFQEQSRRLRPTLKTDPNALSQAARKERLEALAHVNSLCMEALDIAFNAVALGDALPEYEARCPFRGLESFRVEDREFFFGREELTRTLVGKIKAHSFLAVLGASGSGKSSLVMAGMIPAVDLDYVVIRPGTNPHDALESARGKSLLVVDQFEELFTLTRDEKTRADFVSALLDSTKSISVIITLRSDFLGEAGLYRSLSGEIQNHLEIIPPMNADELRRAMEAQARWARLEFEADLSQQILDDVADEPGAMPLLQHALWELWNRRHGRHLRANEYRAFGGVKQAITSTAEKVYGECSKSEQEQVRDIFLRLTRLDEGDEGRDTRRRVPLDELIPSGVDAASISALLDKLANARLIVKTVNDNVTEIEVAHEALIRHWERLRGWLNDDRDNLRLRESVSESAKEWEKSGKHESLLNSRWVKLDEAHLLAQNSRYRLTEIEQAYLDGCIDLRERERTAAARRKRYTIASVAVGLVIIMAILVGWGWTSNENSNQLSYQVATANAAKVTAIGEANIRATAQANAEFQRQKAEQQANIALASQLAAQAQALFVGNSTSQTPVLLAIQSMRLFPAIEAVQILEMNPFARLVALMTYDEGVDFVAFSPDGKYIVSGGGNTAHVWVATTGREVARMTFDGKVSALAFSPDGKHVISGECSKEVSNDYILNCIQGYARVWVATTGREVARMTYDGNVSAVAFSPNGKYVVSGGCDKFDTSYLTQCFQGSARVWDAITGKEVARTLYDSEVTSVAFSPNGKAVVSGSYGDTVRVWDAFTGDEITHMTHGDGHVLTAVYATFSPNGKFVASSWYTTVCVWDAFTGNEISCRTHNDNVRSVAFSPDGNFVVSGCDDGTVYVRSAFSGNEIARMAHDGNVLRGVQSVVFSPDGKYVASGSWDGTARVWNALTGKEITRMTHDADVTSVAFSPDGKYVVSGSVDKTARLWEASGASTDKEFARMTHTGGVYSVDFSSDGKYVISGSDDRTARVWNTFTGKEIALMSYGYLGDLVFTEVYAAFSPDGKYVVSTGCDKTKNVRVNSEISNYYCIQGSIRVWEAFNGKEISRITNDGYVGSSLFSPDGKYVVSSGCNKIDSRGICTQILIRVWVATTGKEVTRRTYDGRRSALAFSPDGKYIVSGEGNIAYVWVATTGREVARMTYDGNVSAVAFSPNGKYVVSGGCDKFDTSYLTQCFQGSARVWDAITGKEVARTLYDGEVTSVAFSPNGKAVVSGSYGDTVRVWDAFTGDEITHMTHDDGVISFAFSPDGKYVVSGSYDNTARVWDAFTGKEIALMTHDANVRSVAFSPDGNFVISGSEDHTVRVWRWHPEDLIVNACSRVSRNLTRAEWIKYIGDAIPYQAVCPNLPIEAESTPTP